METVTAQDLAAARAVLYRFLACAWRAPEEAWRREIGEQTAAAQLALEMLGEGAGGAAADPSLVADIARAASDLPALIREHAELLGHTVQSSVTPYETEWSGWAGQVQQYHQLSDVAAFYHAHGLEVECRERVDFLAVELDFLRFLALKELYGLEQGDAGLVEVALHGQKLFLSEHLGTWAPALCRRVQRHASRGFYALLAQLFQAFLEAEARRFDLRLGDASLNPPAAQPPPLDPCFSCRSSDPAAPAPPDSSGSEALAV